jgi:Cytosolic domain of 10TM putative phosphate transporter
VEGIPPAQRSTSALFAFFNHIYPGQVSRAALCMDTSELEATIGERDKALAGLEKAEAHRIAKPGKPPMQVVHTIVLYKNELLYAPFIHILTSYCLKLCS